MTDDTRPNPSSKDPTLLLALAWSFVGIPLAWGVYETILKSLALFK